MIFKFFYGGRKRAKQSNSFRLSQLRSSSAEAANNQSGLNPRELTALLCALILWTKNN